MKEERSVKFIAEIGMNHNGNFDIYTKTLKGETEFKDEVVETLINFLHIFYVNMVDESKGSGLNDSVKVLMRKYR